jgi:hypothetical protein
VQKSAYAKCSSSGKSGSGSDDKRECPEQSLPATLETGAPVNVELML